MSYFDCDKFMVRRPLMPVRPDEVGSDHWLEDTMDDPFLLEQVGVSSPSMVHTIWKYQRAANEISTKKRRNLFQSLFKYSRRRRDRTTPFGLFVGVSLGQFSGEQGVFTTVSGEPFRVAARVDEGWMMQVIRELEHRYRHVLRWMVNDSVFVRGGRVYQAYCVDQIETSRVHVRYTPVWDTLSEVARELIPYEMIVDGLERAHGHRESCITYVDQLIEERFLVSELSQAFSSSDPLAFLSDQLDRRFEDDARVALREVSEKIRRFEESFSAGENGIHRLSYYFDLRDTLSRIREESAGVRVDAFAGDDVRLPQEMQSQILRCADFMMLLAEVSDSGSVLQEYKERFVDRYGLVEEVRLVDLLDESEGIGIPLAYSKAESPTVGRNLRLYLMREYEEAMRTDQPIQLSGRDIEALGEAESVVIDREKIPSSMELYFELGSRRDSSLLKLSSIVGSFEAGKSFGRFSTEEKAFRDLVLELDKRKQALQPGVETAEIVAIPMLSASGNVVRTVHAKSRAMALQFASSEKDRVQLEDLWIGFTGRCFYVRDGKSGAILRFECNNMLNPHLLPKELRFLLDISHDGEYRWSVFPWDIAYQSFPRTPEIRFEQVILSPRRWLVNTATLGSKDCAASDDAFLSRLAALAERDRIPEDVYVVQDDHRILYHRLNALDQDHLYQEFRKSGEAGIVLEEGPSGIGYLKDGDGHFYRTEIVVPLTRREVSSFEMPLSAERRVPTQERIALPFHEWLYLKLYCDAEREEEYLADFLLPALDQLRPHVDLEFFFLRYRDPKRHLRLRIRGRESSLYAAFAAMMPMFQTALSDGILKSVAADSYDREIERYGGVGVIDAAETFFCRESEVIAHLLQLMRRGQLSCSAEELAIASCFDILRGLGIPAEQRVGVLARRGIRGLSKDSPFRESMNVYRSWTEKDSMDGWRNGDGWTIREALEHRNEALLAYERQMEERGLAEDRRYHAIESLLHMSINRIAGPVADLEQWILEVVSAMCQKELHAGRES